MYTQDRSIRKADLLYKYASGTASAGELAELKELLAEEEADKKLFEDISESELQSRPDSEREQVWQSVKRHTARTQKRPLLRRAIGYAAVGIIVAAGGIALWQQIHTEIPQEEIRAISNIPFIELPTGKVVEIFDSSDVIKILAEAQAETTEQTPDGNTFTKVVVPLGADYNLILPDGSTVYIFPGSELRFTTRFDECRNIELTGEAFFDVKHNPELPFQVTASRIDITVLGTRFNVRSYSGTGIVETALVEGLVNVAGTVIKPNTAAEVNTSNGQIVIRDIVGRDYVARTKSLFVFHDMALEEILNELRLWYDFDFVFEDNRQSSELFTFEIGRDKNIAEIVRRLELTGVVKFDREGTKLIVSPR